MAISVGAAAQKIPQPSTQSAAQLNKQQAQANKDTLAKANLAPAIKQAAQIAAGPTVQTAAQVAAHAVGALLNTKA